MSTKNVNKAFALYSFSFSQDCAGGAALTSEIGDSDAAAPPAPPWLNEKATTQYAGIGL